MTTFAVSLFILTILLTWYALWGRDWFKTTPWGARFLTWIEPFEIFVYKKSQTILVARLLQGLGGLLTLLTQLGSIDITPIMPFVPDKYEGIVRVFWNFLPMIITGLGMVVERLRNTTTLPIETVTLPEKIIAENPRLAEAPAAAQAVKAEAVAVMAEAKAA